MAVLHSGVTSTGVECWTPFPQEYDMLVGSIVERSRANGPGQRTVIWLQGCDRGCDDCCNPELQPFSSPYADSVDPVELCEIVMGVVSAGGVRGVTLSGGEPLHPIHRTDLASFLRMLRMRSSSSGIPVDVMAFTGYRKAEIESEAFSDILPLIDMAIAGPYVHELSNPNGVVASTNQEIVRVTDAFDDVSDDELINGQRIVGVHIFSDGFVRVTGLQSVADARSLLGL